MTSASRRRLVRGAAAIFSGGASETSGAGAALDAGVKAITPEGSVPLPETPVAPAPDDDAIRAARRRRMVQLQARSGRQSTNLSTSETLG